MSKSNKRNVNRVSHKRDVRKSANRSLRRDTRHALKDAEYFLDNDYVDLPEEVEITNRIIEG